MQLRLVCNTPHLFYNPWDADPTLPIDERIVNASGKMRLLDRLLTALLERGHKVLIFSQFTAMLDIIHDYCTGLRGWTVFRIDGGYSIEERRMQIEQFNTDPDSRIFLLSTKAGGHGINLSSADTAILFDRCVCSPPTSRWQATNENVTQATGTPQRIARRRTAVTGSGRSGRSSSTGLLPRER